MTRAAMRPVGRRTRAYFAPLDRVSGTPTIFDPSRDAGFQLDAPPAPWIDLGWIENLRRASTSRIEAAGAGTSGAVAVQTRSSLGARIEFDFRDWGKLQMALSGGSEHMNVLESDPSATRSGSGGVPLPPVPVLSGSTAGELRVGAGSIDRFGEGDLVACDLDYAQQVGYVGSGITAAYVRNPQDVRRDANYVRRVTFNVSRVTQKTATSLLLSQPLPGGTPKAGASVQKVIAFVDREGGTFFQQWSGLFVIQEESGGRVCFYYPRLSPCTPGAEGERERSVEIEKPIEGVALHAAFAGLPVNDDNDGAAVVCYRSFFPAAGAGVY